MVHGGDDLVTILIEALENAGETLAHHDLVIVTSKVVSKAEGQVMPYDGTDEDKVAIVEGESVRILRRRGTLRITETRHGFTPTTGRQSSCRRIPTVPRDGCGRSWLDVWT
jgi:coenzyme F420-0:L-glutamate ligase/coenzyme F420-1:gamma-L-glutamate ligase